MRNVLLSISCAMVVSALAALPAPATVVTDAVVLRADSPEPAVFSRYLFSPDGRTFAAQGDRGSVFLWDVQTGAHKRTLWGHYGSGILYNTDTLAFSPDSKYLASSVMFDWFVRVWDVETGETKHKLPYHAFLSTADFSPDGTTIATGEDFRIRLWDAQTGNLKRIIGEPGYAVHSIDYSPDGKTLVTVRPNADVEVWDVDSGELIRTLDHSPQRAWFAAYSPDGNVIGTAADEGFRIWGAETGELKHIFQTNTEHVRVLAFSPDGQTLAGAADAIYLWDVETGNLQKSVPLEEHALRQNGISFSPDGRAIALDIRPFGNGIEIWDVETGQLQGRFTADFTRPIYSIAFAPDGQSLLAANGDELRRWDLQTAQVETVEFSIDSVYGIRTVEYSPDGTSFFAGGRSGAFLQRTETETTSEIGNTYGNGQIAASYSPGGQTIALAEDQEEWIQISEAETSWRYEYINLSENDDDPVRINDIAYAPGGQTIAVATRKRGVYLIDPTSEAVRNILNADGKEIHSLAYAPDGQTLAAGQADGTVQLWDIQTSELALEIQGSPPRVSSLVFSPDGGRLAGGNYRGEIRLWNPATGAQIAELRGHTDNVADLDYSADGALLASASYDGSIRIWNGNIGKTKPIQWADAKNDILPVQTALLPNFPNPFNPETWIPFDLAQASEVRLTIYDSAGRVVQTLDLGRMAAGAYRTRETAAKWDGRNRFGEPAASGIYFIRFETNGYSAMRRMIMLK